MGAFDRRNGHVIVRVVYDGPSGSGKTANLAALVETFSAQRRGELSSPRRTETATTYFDWLTFNGGVVGGYPLRAQLVTTPGRGGLSIRRLRIALEADVIVFVCDSTRAGVREAKPALELLLARLAERAAPPPIIVQANQQDLPDALTPEAVAAALAIPAAIEVVPASVTNGAGVRETVMRAIRSAATLVERDLVQIGAEAMPAAEDEATLLARLDGSARLGAATCPPLPDEDAPRGDVWPEPGGRRTLRALARAIATGALAVDDTHGAFTLRAGALSARAIPHAAADDARAALHARALERVRLDAKNAKNATATTATTAATFAIADTWLWSIEP
ncbi:MAG: hypothetical protein KIT84_16715 [Labilithrix sp.]|nr:hypothetical protein [Labilithrix sp.]MCW5812674.1 hypothetical protein [Labilithrix sp.]